MFAPIQATTLTKEQRTALESWVRSPTMQSRAVQRARIVLAAAEGISNRQIARELGHSRVTVARPAQRAQSSIVDPLSGADQTLAG